MSVIIYRYDSSPFSVKIDNVLLLKNIPHHKVNVKSLLPRPEITEFLGLGYRRIPILAIGNDIYCDTSLIASALERRFPPAQGYGTIYPKRNDGSYDTGIVKAYARHYADNVIFPLVPVLLPWEKFPEEFIKDRSQYSGNQISAAAMAGLRGKSLCTLTSHVALAEEQLSDGRQWLFNTSVPSLADVALHFPLAWGKTLPGAKDLIDNNKFPNVAKWLVRLTGRIIELKKNLKVDKISGGDAAKSIASSPREADDVVGFDSAEAARLGFKKGDIIQIAPDDTGRAFPTVGQLVGLNMEEFVVETTSSFGTFRCHFPRIGFSVRFPKQTKQKL